ncbi:MAG: hypothetical protein RLZZ08_840 [Pseudomonadota bacterium]|jgi:outer membrane receptor protein involved in Fe transport
MMALAGIWSLPAKARGSATDADRSAGIIDISARTLPQAIAELAREARVSIGAEGTLPNRSTNRIRGAASVAEALAQLLRGSGLVARQVGPTAWRIETAPSIVPLQAAAADPVRMAPPEIAGPPIIVTAAKRAEPLAQAPYDVTVIAPADHVAAGVSRGSGWVAANSDGVALAGSGPGRNRMFLRGVADSPFNGDSASTVAVLLDDARLTFSAPDPDIRLIDVERVEVLKGPQGTLYGTGALGGIYRIVTRAPDAGREDYTVAFGLERVGQGGLGQSGSATANVPLAQDRLGLRLVGYAARDAGWVDSGARANGNSATTVGLRTRLGLEAGDWRADATAFGQWLNSADSAYVYQHGARSRPAQAAEPHDNDLRHLALRLERRGDTQILLSSGVTWQEVRDRFDATQGAAGIGQADPAVLDQARRYRVWDSELRLSRSTGPITWLGGLSHLEAEQRASRALVDTNGGTLPLADDRRVATDSALFGEAKAPLLAGLSATLGARLFRSHFEELRQLPATASRDATKWGITPNASLAWNPRPGRLVYLRYGSAFRQGGSSLRDGGGLNDLASDELATTELGWREAVAGGTLTLSAWNSNWENVQSDVLLANARFSTINAGDARITGVDLGWSGPIGPRLHAELAGNYTAALLVSSRLDHDLEDRHLPLIPHATLRGRLIRDWTLGAFDLRLELGLRYVGQARLSFDPQIDYPLGDYVEGDLAVRLRRGGMDLSLALANIGNSGADAMPFGNPLRLLLGRQFTPIRPRTITLQVAKAF